MLTIFLICKCFVLTLDIYGKRWRVVSIFVLRLAVIMPSVLRADGREMITSLWCLNQCLVLLVPGVISFWVSITFTGQVHCTTLRYFTRGAQQQRGKLWSILEIVWIERHLMLEYTICKSFFLGKYLQYISRVCPKCMIQYCCAWKMLSLSIDTNYIQLLWQNMCDMQFFSIIVKSKELLRQQTDLNSCGEYI